jgi:putative Holliday junction resolvase
VRRILGIDLGERRIGIAVGDPDIGLARPLVTIRRGRSTSDDAVELVRIAGEQDVGELVVGLPLNADGSSGEQARITRQWADEISALIGLRVTLRDERLTSHLAEQRLGPMKRGRSGGPPTRAQREAHRARVDREAAAIILQDELDARRHDTDASATNDPMETSR